MALEEGEAQATTDHVMPRIKGGRARWENEIAACARCNNRRGHMDAFRFFWLLHNRPRRVLVSRRRGARRGPGVMVQPIATLGDLWPA